MCWIRMDWNRKRKAFCLLGDCPAKAGFWKGNPIWKSSYQSLQTICYLSGHTRVKFCSRQEQQHQDPGVTRGWPLAVWRGHRVRESRSLGFARERGLVAPGSASWAIVCESFAFPGHSLYCSYCSLSYLIAVSNKCSSSQPVIFTLLCFQFSSPAAAAGGEEWESSACLRCFIGNTKLRNAIPKPWHSTLRSHGPKASRQAEKEDKWSKKTMIK